MYVLLILRKFNSEAVYLPKPYETIAANTSLLTIVIVRAALYFGMEVLVPLALASLLAFLVVPASAQLERWGLRCPPGRYPSSYS